MEVVSILIAVHVLCCIKRNFRLNLCIFMVSKYTICSSFRFGRFHVYHCCMVEEWGLLLTTDEQCFMIIADEMC